MSGFLLYVLIATLTLVALSGSARKRLESTWRRTAKDLGLRYESRSGQPSLTGRTRRGPVSVTLDDELRSGRLSARSIRLRIEDRELPASLVVLPSTQRHIRDLTPAMRALNEGLETPAMSVTGHEPEVAALLDYATRQRLARAVEHASLTIESGSLSVSAPRFRSAWVSQALDEVMEIATSLALDTEEVPGRLLRNARTDPLTGVRRRCLELLLEHYPDSSEADAVTDWVLAHGHSEAKLLAAARLGSEKGHRIVRDVAEDAKHSPAVRVRALTILQGALPADELRAVVRNQLGSYTPLVRRWAIDVAAQLGMVTPLLELAERTSSLTTDCIHHLIGGLRHIGGRRVEAGVLAVAERCNDARVLRQACELLATVGSTQSVVRLTELSRGLFADPAVKLAARLALEKIRAGLGDADRGRLAVVDDTSPDGALSVASTTGGLALDDGEVVGASNPTGSGGARS